MANPLTIFPEELWIIILSSLDMTIQSTLSSVINTFAELHSALRKCFVSPQLTQVSPRVFDYQPAVDYPQISNLVTKDWCTAVYRFLEQHPLEKSSHFGDGTKHQLIVSQFEFYYPMIAGHLELQEPRVLSTIPMLQSFAQSLRESPDKLKRLPAVEFCHKNFHVLEYLSACEDFLSEFGSALQSVSLTIAKFGDAERIWEKVLQCFRHLRNVQAFSIGITEDDTLAQIIRKSKEFPKMPKLKQLEIQMTGNEMWTALMKYFIKGYLRTGKVEKLILHERWNVLIRESVVEYQVKPLFASTIREFLIHQTPKSLQVTLEPGNGIQDMFNLLAVGNLAVESLVVDNTGSDFKLEDYLYEGNWSFPSVKYLRITDKLRTGYQLLKALPSLEHLHVLGCQITKNRCFNDNSMIANRSLTSLLRQYFYAEKISKWCNIWKELPSLKSLIVQEKGIISKHFTRQNRNNAVVFKTNIN